jgi:hypothetical protein
MEFPPDWDIRPQEDFDLACTALASSEEPALVQLLAQLRPTGRILDNFRFSIGGSQILEAELDLGAMIPAESLQGYRLTFQYWPRDIAIRRNMMSSSWQDVPNLVASNNATVLDPTGAGVPSAEFQHILEELPDEGTEGCAIRWAVVVGEDGHLKLQLQSLPSDAPSLNGRPLTKG